MLTAQQRFISLKSYGRDWVLGLAVGGSLLLLLLNAAFSVSDWYTPRPQTSLEVDQSKTATPLGLALAGVRVDKLETRHLDKEKDKRLKGGMSGYLLPFVIVSVHLLVVLIGAAYMARTKRAAPRTEPAAEGKPD
jgi:NADH-quinone oxidoreductase subunit J